MLIDSHGKTLFTEKELACRGTGEVRLAPGFGDMLIFLRSVFNRPMIVNSCCRSWAYNETVGGHAHSLHVYDEPHHPVEGTVAIDIKTPDAGYARELARLALELGWSVGVAPRFLHLDRRDLAGLDPGLFGYGP